MASEYAGRAENERRLVGNDEVWRGGIVTARRYMVQGIQEGRLREQKVAAPTQQKEKILASV